MQASLELIQTEKFSDWKIIESKTFERKKIILSWLSQKSYQKMSNLIKSFENIWNQEKMSIFNLTKRSYGHQQNIKMKKKYILFYKSSETYAKKN